MKVPTFKKLKSQRINYHILIISDLVALGLNWVLGVNSWFVLFFASFLFIYNMFALKHVNVLYRLREELKRNLELENNTSYTKKEFDNVVIDLEINDSEESEQ